MRIQSLFIKKYQQLCDFKMYFAHTPQTHLQTGPMNRVNINLLVGPNGSGKSTLIDALYALTAKYLAKQPMTFEFTLDWTDQGARYETTQDKQNSLPWDRVVRLYTGFTERNALELSQESSMTEHAYSLNGKDCGYALFVTLLYRACQLDVLDDSWLQADQLIWNNPTRPNASILPRVIWLELSSLEEEDDLISVTLAELDRLKLPQAIERRIGQNKLRLFWSLNELKGTELANPWQIFSTILRLFQQGKISDTGFLFCRGDEQKNLMRSEDLSDGELGFYTRFALIYLLQFITHSQQFLEPAAQTFNQRCLVLLDEPEVHFNEYWKAELIYHICKCLESSTETSFDVFISTHSAMLITDAKPEEIHRLQHHPSGIMAFPPPINTYGTNPIDIGRSLFMMESDIGRRSKQEIEKVLNEQLLKENASELEKQLRDLMRVVGPGEWRWRLRNKLRDVERMMNAGETSNS